MEYLPPSPQVICLVYKEVTMSTTYLSAGIKVFPSEEDLNDLQGVKPVGHETPAGKGLSCPKLPLQRLLFDQNFLSIEGTHGETCFNVLKWGWMAELGL